MKETLFFILGIINCFGIGIFLYSFRKIVNGPVKWTFYLCLFFGLSWVNSLLIINLPQITLEQAHLYGGWFILGSALMAIFFLGLFMLYFCGEKYITWKFALVSINFPILLLLLFTGNLVDGVKLVDGFKRPVYNELSLSYMIASWVIFKSYVFFQIYKAYHSAVSIIFQFQIQKLFKVGIVSTIYIMITTTIIPQVTGVPYISSFGSLGPLIILWGILEILINEKSIYIKTVLNEVLKHPLFNKSENVDQLNYYFWVLKKVLFKKSEKIREEFCFTGTDGDDYRFQVTNESNQRQLRQEINFSGKVAHELQQPLTAVRYLATSLKNNLQGEPRSSADLIVRTVNNASQVMHTLLALNGKRARDERLMSEFDIQDSIQESIDSFLITEPESKIEFDSKENFIAIGNRPLFMRVIGNLLSNAHRSIVNDPGGKIVIKTTHGKNYNQISVRDNGHGMSEPAIHEALAKQPEMNSTGLITSFGLLFVREVVQDVMKGNIRIESREGEFFEAIITLPVVEE